MIYFLIPNVNNDVIYNLKLNNDNNRIISYSLSNYLNDIKKIDFYENDWDIYKKFTNPFEYINTTIIKKKIFVYQS